MVASGEEVEVLLLIRVEFPAEKIFKQNRQRTSFSGGWLVIFSPAWQCSLAPT